MWKEMLKVQTSSSSSTYFNTDSLVHDILSIHSIYSIFGISLIFKLIIVIQFYFINGWERNYVNQGQKDGKIEGR